MTNKKLREDPVIRKVLDSGLCFQPTLSRFENKADRSLIYQMSQWFVDRYVEELKEKTGQIIIDVDGTDDPTHGSQQLSLYNGYYGQTMYHELFFKGREHRSGHFTSTTSGQLSLQQMVCGLIEKDCH